MGKKFLRVITTERFEKMMREIVERDLHPEDQHLEMDALMCETLRQLGYGKGVDIFENTEKWYA